MRAAALALMAALAANACVHERTKAVGFVDEGALAPPASPASHRRDFFDREAAPPREPYQGPTIEPPLPEVAPADDRKITVSVAPPAHRAIPAGESLEDRARTKFLSSTTDVSADRLTLYVPRAYEGELLREGLTVARLRHLTVRASQLTVVVRDGNPDVQLSARGGVSFRSDQPASVIEESGLRSLLLKNDGYTPLH